MFKYDEYKLPLFIKKGNSFRCLYCGLGAFTRRGIYLHLIRKHMDELVYITRELLQEYGKVRVITV